MKKRLFLFNLSALIIYYIFLSCVNGSKKIIKMNKYEKKGKNKKIKETWQVTLKKCEKLIK